MEVTWDFDGIDDYISTILYNLVLPSIYCTGTIISGVNGVLDGNLQGKLYMHSDWWN